MTQSAPTPGITEVESFGASFTLISEIKLSQILPSPGWFEFDILPPVRLTVRLPPPSWQGGPTVARTVSLYHPTPCDQYHTWLQTFEITHSSWEAKDQLYIFICKYEKRHEKRGKEKIKKESSLKKTPL